MVGEEWQVGLSPTSVAASQLKPLLGSPHSCNFGISELSGSALLSLISTHGGVMARHFPSVCRQVFLLKSCLRMGCIISRLALRPLPLRDWSSGGNRDCHFLLWTNISWRRGKYNLLGPLGTVKRLRNSELVSRLREVKMCVDPAEFLSLALENRQRQSF